jgi:hypothetical protein
MFFAENHYFSTSDERILNFFNDDRLRCDRHVHDHDRTLQDLVDYASRYQKQFRFRVWQRKGRSRAGIHGKTFSRDGCCEFRILG